MQRVDHPDPAAANAQALHDLENGATGLTLVCRGSVGAYGYGLDASRETLERVLDGVYLDAGIAIDFDRQRRDARCGRRTSPRWCDSRGIGAGKRSRCAAALDPLGGMAATGSAVRRGASSRPPSRRWSASSPGKGFAGRSRSPTAA